MFFQPRVSVRVPVTLKMCDSHAFTKKNVQEHPVPKHLYKHTHSLMHVLLLRNNKDKITLTAKNRDSAAKTAATRLWVSTVSTITAKGS